MHDYMYIYMVQPAYRCLSLYILYVNYPRFISQSGYTVRSVLRQRERDVDPSVFEQWFVNRLSVIFFLLFRRTFICNTCELCNFRSCHYFVLIIASILLLGCFLLFSAKISRISTNDFCINYFVRSVIYLDFVLVFFSIKKHYSFEFNHH